jgi:hypothetical protein
VTASFGGQGYVSQESRALSTISETPAADLSQGQDAQIKMLQSHDYQIKFLAGQMKQAQKGINEANQNPIQQIESFIADIIVLLGGGELAAGALDFGDLQYILPALGALFGFGDGPFPLSLFTAAEKFFLGYVVPQQQFVDVINQIIENWLGLLGIDPKFVKDLEKLVTSIGDLFDGIGNLFPSLNELFDALGITSADLGPLGQALKPIIDLFQGINLDGFGDIVEFITDAIDPWITGLTAVINWINSVLAVFGFGAPDVVNNPLDALLAPFQNLISMLGGVNFADEAFDAINAAGQFITNVLSETGLLALFTDLQGVIDAIVHAFQGLPNPGGLVSGVFTAIAGLLGIGNAAQTTANNAMREISALKSLFLAAGGVSFVENFSTYASAAYLPSPYTRWESGPGAGSAGPDGSSGLSWHVAGGSPRCTIYTNPSVVITSGKIGAAMILENNAGRAGPTDYIGVVDSAGNGYGVGVEWAQAGFVHFVAGVPSALITPFSYTAGSGDSWEFYYGSAAHPRSAAFILNSGPNVSTNDCGVTISGNMQPAFGESALTFFLTQAVPAVMGSFTFFESSL